MKYCILLCISLMIFNSMTSYAVASTRRDEVRITDSYGKLSWKELKERLSAHVFGLENGDSKDILYYYYYGDAKTCLSKVRKQAMRSKNYIIKKYNVSAERIVLIEGGYRDKAATDVFIQPPTFQMAPTPTIEAAQAAKNCR